MNSKYFAAQNEQDWQRRYLYLSDHVRGNRVVTSDMLDQMRNMDAQGIIAMLESMPPVRDQPLPL